MKRAAHVLLFAAFALGACRALTGTGDLVLVDTSEGVGGNSVSATTASASVSSGTGGAGGSIGVGSSSSSTTTTTASSSSSSGTGLDPKLKTPDPNGTPCTTPYSSAECPSLEVCRIATATTCVCESCGACGNLYASCSKSSDCDIVFQCYAGKCTNFCMLGSQQCGGPQNCIDVGYKGGWGVCKPM
jgi:hypothetical protein